MRVKKDLTNNCIRITDKLQDSLRQTKVYGHSAIQHAVEITHMIQGILPQRVADSDF